MGIYSFVKIYIVLFYVIMLKIFLFLCIDHQIGTMEQCEELDVTLASRFPFEK